MDEPDFFSPYRSDLRGVSAFVAVADWGSLRSASTRLRIPRSTLSDRIHRLEQELGVELLRKKPPRGRLTIAGKEFLVRCQTLFEGLEAAAAATRMTAERSDRWYEELVGTVRVGVPAFVGPVLLAKAATWLRERAPRVTVGVRVFRRPIDFAADGVEVVLALGPAPVGRGAREFVDLQRVRVSRPDARAWPEHADPEISLPHAREGLGSAMVPRFLVAKELERGDLVVEERGEDLVLHVRFDPFRMTGAAVALMDALGSAASELSWDEEEIAGD